MTAQAAGWTPTDAQRELIESRGSLFVEACPGSGKTKAIVARYERLVSARLRRGVALVSFTNAAVDEVTARCSDPRLLAAPNFVGTFDSFINRFITGPYVAKVTRRFPRFVDSWASIPGAKVRVPSMKHGISFDLDWFDWNDQGQFVLDRGQLGGPYSQALQDAYGLSPGAIDGAADALLGQLVKDRQILSCAASRNIASSILTDASTRSMWQDLLAARFAEVIVDEAQDSGAEELSVLQAALTGGADVVMVADLDQSIFEFRRADPDRVRLFASALPVGVPLMGNFRSSPAISRAGTSLRAGAQVEEPVGPNRDNVWPVHLLSFNALKDVAAALPTLLGDLGLAIEDCKVLAHRRKDAIDAAGALLSTSTSGRKVLRIARAHLVLDADLDPARRRQAIGDVERVILELAFPNSTDLETTGGLADQLGVSGRWLRSCAIRIAMGADPAVGRADYTRELRRIAQGLPWPKGVTISNLGKQLATPPAAEWDEHALDPPGGFPWGTIHSAKGREFEAVVVVIPKKLIPDREGRTCLDLWESGQDGESRRVLYVGATRARRLIVMAVHNDHAGRVRQLLDGCPLAPL